MPFTPIEYCLIKIYLCNRLLISLLLQGSHTCFHSCICCYPIPVRSVLLRLLFSKTMSLQMPFPYFESVSCTVPLTTCNGSASGCFDKAYLVASCSCYQIVLFNFLRPYALMFWCVLYILVYNGHTVFPFALSTFIRFFPTAIDPPSPLASTNMVTWSTPMGYAETYTLVTVPPPIAYPVCR